MEIKKVIKDGDRYFCNEMDVSVEEWKNILQDNSLMYDTYKDTLIKLYKEPEHKSTCKALEEKYNSSSSSLSGTITQFAKAVQKKLNRFDVVGTNEKPSYWIIPMLGKSIGKYFEWTLRPELVQAMEEIGMTKTIEIMDKQIFTEILNFFTKTAQAKIYARSQLQGKYNYTRVDTTHNVISKVYKKEDNIKHYEEIDASWFDKGLKCIHFMNGNAQNKNRAFRHANFHIYNPNLQTDLAIEIGPIFSENKTLDNSSDDNYDTICGYYVTLFETGYEKHKNIDKQTKDYDKEFYKTFAITDIDGIYAYVNELLSKISQNMKPDNPFLNSVIELLQSNGNIILTGAPGTGKTYLAKQIAEAMGAIKENKNMEFVQFHPSYDYTDFVEGLRPAKPDEKGNIGFKRIDGVFKNFCKKAKDNPDKDHVFIIDEINRGEISKIFGELFFSIDPNYRGEKGKVQTQYQNLVTEKDKNGKDEPFYKGFYVPENVYIIGTMNDIDRSVESFDFAMRRRFTWKEITAEESQRMFENETWKDEAIKRMNALNSAISNIQGLGAAYHIGAAYFKNNLPKYADNPFENLWNYHLKSLLFEYLRGMPDAETKLKELENAYNPKFYTTF